VRFAPLVGALIGLSGGAVYWVSLQVWPTSVAVILAMAMTMLAGVSAGPAGPFGGDLNLLPATRIDACTQTLYLMIKYSTLMALSAAKLPFAAPAEAVLGLIMICGFAASGALVVSTLTVAPAPAKLSHTDLGLTLLMGFAPAVLLGIPGLTGLVAAILASLAFTAYLKISGAAPPAQRVNVTQQLTEVAFYLGALATWSYV
jgi:adenosylcobinamide-GDP ribazoletransferase